jgi:murein DD-endopeptidase MepM/ murein hydrolase activator NlpD
MPLDNKISNIIGTKLPTWVLNQLETRSNKNTQDSRDNDNILYLANKSAWIRLVSSVNINDYRDINYFKNIIGANIESPVQLFGSYIANPTSLAKQYVLFGGTSKYLNNNSYGLRSGLDYDGAYGMLGESEVQQFGYKPMPGITNVTIDTQGRLGSVRAATINFKCWDKNQLDIIDALYFKLGFTMFLEWGHTFYYPSPQNTYQRDPNKIISTELYSIDPFEEGLNKEDIQIKIAKNSRETEGNYDAMLGICTNFNFTYTQDGGYDCTLRLMALGVLGDAIKINNSGTLPNLLEEEIIQLNNTLFEISNSLNKTPQSAGGPSNPSDLQAYPECVRSLDGGKLVAIPNNKLVGGINRNTAFSPYAISAIVNNVNYYFYVDGRYQTNGLTASGSYLCKEGILHIDNKKADDITKYSYEEVINGSKDNTRQETSLKNSYYILKDKGKYDYIAINKLKSVLPIDSDKDIEATINLEKLEILPSFTQNGLIVSDVLGNALNRNANQLTRSPGAIDLTRGFTPTPELPGVPAISNTPNNNTNINTDLYSGFGIGYFNPESGRLKDGSRGGTGDDYRVELQYNGVNNNIYFLKLEYEYNAIGSYKNDFQNKVVSVADKSSQAAFQNEILAALRSPSTIWKLKSVQDDTFENKQKVTRGLFEAQTIVSINKTFKNLNQKKLQPGPNGEELIENVDENVKLELPITITFSDLEILESFSIKDPSDLILPITQRSIDTNQNQTQSTAAATEAEPQKFDREAISTQIKQALNYQSTLEIMLRTIQLHALNKAINKTGTPDLEIARTTYVLEIAKDKTFLDQIFSTGVFSSFINELINKKSTEIKDSEYTTDTKMDVIKRFKIYSKYGFATNLLGNKEDIRFLQPVDFEELLKAYVVPYQINQEIIKGTSTNHPVYIPLGLILMILNHACTIYDSKEIGKFQSPLVYIDFNPELNFCLTNTKQLSTDPWTCLIPFEGSFEDYKELFDKDILTSGSTAIDHTSGSKETIPLFNPKTDDFLSGTLPRLKFDEKTDSDFANALNSFLFPSMAQKESGNIYRGKVMNILLNVDYLVNLAQQYSYKDGTNSVYLKTYIEQILSDVNKSLGNFNAFRLSYNDAANTFQIVDDQFIPSLSSEQQVTPKSNTTELPLSGKFSIAKSLEIKSEVSSKLSNMLAISANANSSNKATLSTNGDSFGFVNTAYSDRFVSIRGEITGSGKKDNDSLKISAAQFNSTISDFYSKINPSQTSVAHATNYYIEKMSLIKNEDYATRAAAMIPVSVNFTTDGISGLGMGQAFTLPDQLLPYTYTTRKIPGAPQDYINNVGFVMVGLTHTIENNQWNTAVRANMIYLKDKTAFSGSVVKVDASTGVFGVNEFNVSQNLHGDSKRGSGGSTVPRNTDQTVSITSPATSTYIFGAAKNLGGSVNSKAHGARESNQKGQWQSENAWDLMVPAFTPVYAIFEGTITNVNFYEDVPFIWGYRFTLVGTNEAFYTHLDRSIYKSGTKVKKGDLIGYIGQPPIPDYKWSTHLHIGLRSGNLYTYLKNDGQII